MFLCLKTDICCSLGRFAGASLLANNVLIKDAAWMKIKLQFSLQNFKPLICLDINFSVKDSKTVQKP